MTASAVSLQPHHRADFYDSDAEIVASVVRFLRPAMAGGVGIVVGTPDHRRDIIASLAPHRAGSSPLRLISIDADQTLERFMDGDMPDAGAFNTVIGDILRINAQPQGPVRVFGEMVALLWQDGNVTGALAVEELWNELAQQHPFSLLCGYPSMLFTHGESTSFDAVCAKHTSVSVSPQSRLASRTHVRGLTASDGPAERWHLPQDPISGAEARHRLRGLLHAWGMDALLDDAVLLTTELVNNVVVHTSSPVLISVRRREAVLRIEVTDVGDGVPRRLEADITDTHGRGLMMVDSISSAWGTDLHDRSKTTWFELALS